MKSFSFSENVYSASFRDDGKLMCAGFESNNARVYPLFGEDTVQDMNDADSNAATKIKKTPLRKFEDHLGLVDQEKMFNRTQENSSFSKF